MNKLYLVRNENNSLYLFSKKPIRRWEYKDYDSKIGEWTSDTDGYCIGFIDDKNYFSDIDWKCEPIEVEIVKK